MKRVFGLVLIATLMFVGVSLAADVTVYSNGTYVKQASGINFKGPAVADNGTGVNVDFATMTGAQAITGNVVITGTEQVTSTVTANSSVFVDGSLYMTTASPAAAAGVGLWISQPDGGCSKCYVDAAGTTWACANATCPSGM